MATKVKHDGYIEENKQYLNILSDLYERLTVIDNETKKELIKIDCNGIEITSSNLEVHLLPKK